MNSNRIRIIVKFDLVTDGEIPDIGGLMYHPYTQSIIESLPGSVREKFKDCWVENATRSVERMRPKSHKIKKT